MARGRHYHRCQALSTGLSSRFRSGGLTSCWTVQPTALACFTPAARNLEAIRRFRPDHVLRALPSVPPLGIGLRSRSQLAVVQRVLCAAEKDHWTARIVHQPLCGEVQQRISQTIGTCDRRIGRRVPSGVRRHAESNAGVGCPQHHATNELRTG